MKHFSLAALLLCFSLSLFAQNYSVQLQSGSFVPAAKPAREDTWVVNEVVGGKYYRFIQFYNIPTEAQKAQLAAKGIKLLSYIPNNVYLASVSASANLLASGTENIRSMFPVKAEYKLNSQLAKGIYPESAKRSGNKIELVVQHMPGLSTIEVEAWLKGQGAEIVYTLRDIESYRLVIGIADINKIAALPYVLFMEPEPGEPEPDNLVGRSNHRSNTISTDQKNGLKFDGTGVNIALNDDGVIGPHIDYTGRLLNTFIAYNSGDHGDHCAGTIFGAGNRDPITRGMAPGANLGVYGVGGTPTGYQAFDSIYNHYNSYGIRITSTSYSNGNNTGYTSLARTMDIQINTMSDLMHVFSAGNSGTSDFGYGAGAGWGNITGGHKQAKNVMAVGNLDYLDALASSSSRGPAHDGRIKPDICAVGTNVYSTQDVNTYQNMSGTSMACPAIAGVLAQLYQAYKQSHSGQNPPSALMKASMLNTADDLGNAGPDYRFGWGRVNARRAYDVVNKNQYLVDSVSQSGNKTHTITVPAGTAELRVMVYWQDREAVANATKALVNNLDMKVTDPSSAQVLPWVLNRTPNATTLNTPAVHGVDTLNNMEQVTIPNPASGNYVVSVDGFSVPFGPQKYYVVYEFVPANITVTYPTGGESFVPGISETIRWDAPASASTFTLEYSTNGTTWNNIASGVSATSRSYNWTPPAVVTGKAFIRVTRGSVSDVSDIPFSIIGVPGSITVNWVCADSIKVTYGAVTGATGYIVTILGTKYMDSAGYSTTTSCVAHGINTTVSGWVSVQATGPDNCIGRRRIASTYPAVPFNCTVLNDMASMKAVSPTQATEIACSSAPYTTQVAFDIKNFSLSAMSNVIVKYSIDGGTPVSEVFAGPLAPQATATYTFTALATIATAGNHVIKAWTEFAGDQVPANDTITWNKIITNSTMLTLPVAQDFESFSTCDTTANCGTTICALGVNCINGQNGTDDDVDWRVNSGATPSKLQLGTTGPAMDYKPGSATGKYVYLEATGCAGKRADLVIPCINLSGAQNPELRFAYHMYGAAMGDLHLDIMTAGNWTNDVMTTLSGDKGNNWNIATLSLQAYTGSVISIRIRGVTGLSETSDMALDDITIREAVGISKLSGSEMDVQVFPNPSDGSFNIRFANISSEVELAVTDINGNLISHQQVPVATGAVTVPLQLKNAPAGVYFLSVRSQSYVMNRKLIKL